ncbi:MAG TPA: PilW family protein [Steroidobacteraceae bacterium]|nr:PilW family protein [Steroidobacteraceae bacterium]
MHRQQQPSDRCPQRSGQHGFSLIELMVSIAISLLLLAGVVTMFIGSKESYETSERLSRVQENGRYALDQIVDDLRSAGFQGCAKPNFATSRANDYAVTTLNNPTALLNNFAAPVQGFDAGAGGGTWTPALDAAITAGLGPSNISDVLALHVPRRDAVAMHLTVRQTAGTDPLTVGNVVPAPLSAGDIAMISDCTGRAWFQVTTYAGGVITHTQSGVPAGGTPPGNASADLKHPFDVGAEIVPAVTVIYYIRPSPADPTTSSLYRRSTSPGGVLTEELADGIERLEFQYGVDTVGGDGRIDQYVTANAVTNWEEVISVRVALLARATEAYGRDLDRRTYVLFDGTAAIGPFNDRFERRVFTTTVALRNQVID